MWLNFITMSILLTFLTSCMSTVNNIKKPGGGIIVLRANNINSLFKYNLNKVNDTTLNISFYSISISDELLRSCKPSDNKPYTEPVIFTKQYSPSGNAKLLDDTLDAKTADVLASFDDFQEDLIRTANNKFQGKQTSVIIEDNTIKQVKLEGVDTLVLSSESATDELCEVLGLEKAIRNEGLSVNDSEITQQFIGLGDYGNWCGYNNTRSDPNYPVVDEVDEVCRDHDLCIIKHGYHKCSCDGNFLRRMPIARARNENGEAYKLESITAFLNKPCECRHEKCIKLCNFRRCWRECRKWSTPGIGGQC